ncbi:ATP-grasp domain-containing protein [Holdemania massiliensis]|uniref:ATP-grasp domain-containing protein n=1 Tax=Holdemania massiliensis TaxID=1468449 RepID=UPI00030C7056|nr:ATP-grasp domain-containing protein [Holdemania massiliensis]
MINFVLISPHFPSNYWLFARALKNRGVRVLGIVDTPQSSLPSSLRKVLDDVYCVYSMTDRDQMIRACGYFTWKYGKLDWIESNNEYWLNLDAELRELFHVTTGMFPAQLNVCQHKSLMKAKYAEAGVPTARWLISEDPEAIRQFAQQVHYSMVAKPDRGVGASDTMRIHNAEELETMLKTMHSGMIVEEFVQGTVCTFDGIINNQGKVVFATSHVYLGSVMDSVNEKQPIGCYSLKNVQEDLRSAGERTLQAFGVRDRFFHLEFFRLDCDQEGLGHKGDIIGLEVNMRPPGGFLPDMIDYANDIDIYQIWADTLIDHEPCYNPERPYSSVFVGRRKEQHYQHSTDWIVEHYHEAIVQRIAMDPALAEAMGDEVLIARFPTEQQVFDFYADCIR